MTIQNGSRYSLFTYYTTSTKTDAQCKVLKVSKYFWPTTFTNKYVKHRIKYESVAKELYATDSKQNILPCGFVLIIPTSASNIFVPCILFDYFPNSLNFILFNKLLFYKTKLFKLDKINIKSTFVIIIQILKMYNLPV